MVIDAGEAEVPERLSAERLEHAGVRGGGLDLAAGQLFEERLEIRCVHLVQRTGSIDVL
jgi:hypothetical protein